LDEALLLSQLIPIPLITKTHTEAYNRRPRLKNKISYFLRSSLPKNIELTESIGQLMHAINTQYQLCIEFIHCGFGNENCLKEQDRIAIYLIVKAQLGSILKNSTATSATIHLAKNNDLVAIVIEDNGTAVDTTKIKNNRGQRTMQNLVRHHKGQYNVIFEREKGTVVEILIHVTETSK
jgi:signal transduction histidine kinase